MIIYGSVKLQKLVDHDNFKLESRILENKFALNETFTNSDGLMLAAGIFEYGHLQDDIIDPEIGEIKFYLKKYDLNSQDLSIVFDKIETRPCQIKDFNDVEDSKSDTSSFFKTELANEKELEIYGPRMLCPKDETDLQILGSYS